MLGAVQPLMAVLDHLERMQRDKEIKNGPAGGEADGEYRSVLVKNPPGSQPELEGAGNVSNGVPFAQGVAQGVARPYVRESGAEGPRPIFGPAASAPAVTTETGRWRYSADTWHGPSLHR